MDWLKWFLKWFGWFPVVCEYRKGIYGRPSTIVIRADQYLYLKGKQAQERRDFERRLGMHE